MVSMSVLEPREVHLVVGQVFRHLFWDQLSHQRSWEEVQETHFP